VSIVQIRPEGARKKTKDNTPAVIHYEIVRGNPVRHVAAKAFWLGKHVEVRELEPSARLFAMG